MTKKFLRRLNRKRTIQILENVIEEVGQFYKSSPEATQEFLSENDFQCLIYSKLRSRLYDGLENILACNVTLHTEVSFYEKAGLRLKFRPDLTLFFRKGIKWSDRDKFDWNFESEAVIAILEIKFIKSVNKKVLKEIQYDIDKLSELQKTNSQQNREPKVYLLCFSFAGAHQAKVQRLASRHSKIAIKFFPSHLN